jgi:hypothetical protein
MSAVEYVCLTCGTSASSSPLFGPTCAACEAPMVRRVVVTASQLAPPKRGKARPR